MACTTEVNIYNSGGGGGRREEHALQNDHQRYLDESGGVQGCDETAEVSRSQILRSDSVVITYIHVGDEALTMVRCGDIF